MGKEKKNGNRPNVERVRTSAKFDSVRQIDFRLWKPGFLSKAATNECLKFFEAKEELTFVECRPCAVGEEETFVDEQLNTQMERLRKTFKKNCLLLDDNAKVSLAKKASVKMNLEMELNKEIDRIANTRDRVLKDLETSIVIFEKKERVFQVGQAAAVNLLFENLGPNCLDCIKAELVEVKPLAAWKKLEARFDSGKGGSANTSNILDEMRNFVIEKKNGSIIAGIHYLKSLASEYNAAGSAPLDKNLVFTFLLDAIERGGMEEFKELVHDAKKPGATITLEVLEEYVAIIESREAYQQPKDKKDSSKSSTFQNALKNLESAEQLMSLLAKVTHAKRKKGKTSTPAPFALTVSVCTVCNRKGHTKDTCWKNHTCTICKKKGHHERVCRQRPDTNSDKKKFNVSDFTNKS